ncbi:MAG: protein translocase subunit SecF [Candidatus Levybacteria bacterium]|nr:protein translocase subunit SecF [Candidatus Levybacteria bacterium]
MMDIVGKKYFYFLVSLLVIIPGLISIALFGLRLSIDFQGGSRVEIQNSKFKIQNSEAEVRGIFRNQGIDISSLQKSGEDVYIIRAKPIDEKAYEKVTKALQEKFKGVKVLSFQTIGPTISRELTLNAFKALVLASVLIVLYIAWSFRKVPKPVSSWRFGVCAIIALLHDVLIVVGVFSILGKLFSVEVDSLFVTALLTVIGFSVHDTIVVFDRIRENLRRMPEVAFSQVVNASILQTFTRSLNTSLTTMLVLFTLLLFGGETLRWFIVALLIGIASGTYSSIFNAAPLLVVWEEWSQKRKSNSKVIL